MRFPVKWFGLVMIVLTLDSVIPDRALAQSVDSAPLLQVEGVLEAGDAVTPDKGSLYDTYTFEGQAGQTVSIVMESLEFDTYLLLLDPQGQILEENDDYDEIMLNSVIAMALPQDGSYTIRAGAYDAENQGRYTLTVQPVSSEQQPPTFSDAALRQAEAHRLNQQGIQQYTTSQFQEALTSFQQALSIYRELGDRTGEGDTLNNMGVVYRNRGQYEQALDTYEHALAISIELGDRTGEGETLNNMGVVYDNLGQFKRALDFYERSLAIRTELGDRQGEGITLTNIGAVYVSLGHYERALEFYEHALALQTELGDFPEERRRQRADAGVTLNNIGGVYDTLGHYERALDAYEQSLAISIELGDRHGEGITLNNMGGVYANLGQYEQALEVYEHALALLTEIGDRRGEGGILNNIGGVYDTLGQYERALDTYEHVLAIRTELGDRYGEGITLNNMGAVYVNLGQYERALNFYEHALAIRMELGDRHGEGVTLNNMGGVYANLGQYEQALEVYEHALALLTEIGDRQGKGGTLTNMGAVYINLGQYERALESYGHALAIQTEIGDRRGEGVTLNNMGAVYSNLGQYERALEVYEYALAIQTEIGDRQGEGATLTSMGLVYHNLGQYERALEVYEHALAISTEIGDRRGEGTALNNIGSVYGKLGEYERALEVYEHALAIRTEIGDREGEGSTLSNMGVVYGNLGHHERALESYGHALAIQTEIGDRAGEAITLNNIGSVLEVLEEPELAIVFFKQSVNQWENIRGDIRGLETEQQQSFTDRVSVSYRRLADLLLQADRVLEAQRVLDLLRVQELDEYLQDVQRNAQTETGAPLRPEEQDALQRFLSNQDQLVALGRELRELEAIDRASRTPEQRDRILELRQLQQDSRTVFIRLIDSPDVQAIVARLRNTTGAANVELEELNALRDNLRQLEQNTVALYPLVLDDRLELVVVTPDAPPVSRTVEVSREDLNRVIANFRSALQSPRLDAVTPAQQLYDWLIRPIETDLTQADTEVILYSPDSQLRYIPLAALHDGDQWLTQRWQVNNIVAASLADLDNQSFQEGLSILAAAFTEGQVQIPISTRTLSFGGLEFAGREVENLAQLIPQTEKRLNDAFDQSLVLEMNDFNIIHLATHATFNPGPPEDSFILFGDGSHATLPNIRSWNFPDVELVVLSACETAVGDVPLGNGAEILGLGYLMQEAGAEAAIASLWSVSDGGTQVLMDAFYTALNNGYSKVESLQRAQQALITSDETVLIGERGVEVDIIDTRTGQPLAQSGDLAHPYYWAPFILIGNGL